MRQRQQGTVWLDIEVSGAGAPLAVLVATSSGHILLDQAALAAVRQWQFEPARLGGKAISSRVQVPVRFRLTG